MPTNLYLTMTESNNTVVITINGEIDVSSYASIVAAAQLALGQGSCGTMILDLDGVSFSDCAGLSALLRIQRECNEHFVKLGIVNVPQDARHLARLLDLDRVLPIN